MDQNDFIHLATIQDKTIVNNHLVDGRNALYVSAPVQRSKT